MSQQVHTTLYQDPASNQSAAAISINTTRQFDNQFFGMSESEASMLDPQYAMLLHTVWECLYNSGQSNPLTDVRGYEWGLFVGMSHCTQSPQAITTGNAASFIARVFDIVGTTLTIDTGHASSLSALDAACLSLNADNCTAALVCGANAILNTRGFELTDNKDLLAPHTDNTNSRISYVCSEGSSAVLLMPLDKACRESKRIHAVLKSTATNTNGALPNKEGQAKLLSKALAKSDIDLSTVRYIETSGTPSRTSDELAVIQSVFESTLALGNDYSKMYLGSLEANIGNLEAGAGLAGLVKTVLVLEHSQIPGNPCNPEPTLCTAHRNIHIPSDTVTEPFTESLLTSAIVNSFDRHGTNATAVLQQYAALPDMTGVKGDLLLLTDTITSADLNEILKTITTLENTYPQFLQSNKACKTIMSKDCAAFKLLCTIATILTALGVSFNTVGGVDILGEILTLAITGAIKDSQALRLVNAYKSRSSFPTTAIIQQFISKPSSTIFSCVLEKVCHSSEYKTELKSEHYAQKFVEMLKGEGSSDKSRAFLTKALVIMSSQSVDTQPLLAFTMEADVEQLAEINETIPDSNILMRPESSTKWPQYIRQKCMELRNLSDLLKLQACTNKPSRAHALPWLHDNYPLREVAAYTQRPDTANESGYITHSGSTESVVTPVKSPAPLQSPFAIKAPPPSPSTLGIKLGVRNHKQITESAIRKLWQRSLAKAEVAKCVLIDSFNYSYYYDGSIYYLSLGLI